MTAEDRRRLRLEREVVWRFVQGETIAAIAERHLVPTQWVEDTIRRAHRGTLRMEPGQ